MYNVRNHQLRGNHFCLMLAGLAIGFTFAVSYVAAAEDLTVAFEGGLSLVRFGELELLAGAAPKVTRVVVTDEYRDRRNEPPEKLYGGEKRTFSNADVSLLKSEFDPDAKTLTQRYQWGKISYAYRQNGNNLDLDVEVSNTSGKVIELVELTLMELQLPEKPAIDRVSSIQRFHSNTNIGGYDVRRASFENGQIVFVSTIPNQPLRQQLALRRGNRLALTVSAGNETGGREVYHGVWDSMPVRPGHTDTYRLSVRFASPDSDVYEMTSDIWRAFGEAFPQTFNWPDRRPIGELHIGDGRRDRRNPRGWFVLSGDPKFPAATDETYMERFREAMLANADRVIEVSRQLGLQGVILWQIEGMQEPGHAYYGEPRILPYVAPEMDAVADEYFRKFRDAGLRFGVTIRPVIQFPFDPEEGGHTGPVQGVVTWEKMREAAIRADWSIQFRGLAWVKEIPEEVRDVYAPEEAWCVLTRLDNKIRYAKERWGATLFYLDSNSFPHPGDLSKEDGAWVRPLLSAEIMQELQRRHPDCLVIPEHQYPQYYAYGAQYSQPPGWGRVTGPDVRAAYPEAAAIIKVTDRKVILDNLDTYVRAVEEGDMQFAAAWYAGDLELIRAVYGKAMESAPFKVAVSDKGLYLGERRLAGPDELKDKLAETLENRPPLRDRRAFVRYAAELPVPELQAVLDAIVEAGGIIGWTQIDDEL